MATITINIPTDKEAWVLSGLSITYQYSETIDNPSFDLELPEDPVTNPREIPNPQSLPAYIKQKLIERIKYDTTQGHMKAHWEAEEVNAIDTNIT